MLLEDVLDIFLATVVQLLCVAALPHGLVERLHWLRLQRDARHPWPRTGQRPQPPPALARLPLLVLTSHMQHMAGTNEVIITDSRHCVNFSINRDSKLVFSDYV